MTTDRLTPGVPLEQLHFDPAILPQLDAMSEAQRSGWACVFCNVYTGGDAPVAGCIKVEHAAVCFVCYRASATPKVGVA